MIVLEKQKKMIKSRKENIMYSTHIDVITSAIRGNKISIKGN